MSPISDVRVDTHAHVFLRDLPMAAGRRYTPATDASLNSYLDVLDTYGLSHGVLVQPSFLGTDNSYLVACIAAAQGRLRGIGVLDPTTAGEEFDRLDAAGVVGVRLNLLGQATPDIASQIWRVFVERLIHRSWQIEIQQHASMAFTLVAQLLDMGATVVLDHFALPDPGLGAADPDWRWLLALGSNGRLWVKLSAAYRNGPEGAFIASACWPILRDMLGLERLMWGSDWPHTQFETVANYAMAFDLPNHLGLNAQERAVLLGSPAALFRLS